MLLREDGGDIDDLTPGSSKIVIYKCEKCNIEVKTKYVSYNKRKNKTLCNECVFKNKTKKTFNSKKIPYYNKLKDMMYNENYILLTTKDDYIKGDAYVDSICPNNHKFKVTYKEWNTKNKRCKLCKEYIKNNRIELICKEMGFIVKSINTNSISLKCLKGHEFKQTLSNFYKKTECGICSNQEKISKPEKEICEYLDTLNIKYESSNRTLIKPYELDIFIPDKNIAIEYNGKWFHDEHAKGKRYHLMKTEMCENKGIRLLHIFDDEWIFDKFKVKHRLKSMLGLGNRIYARKCIIKKINTKIAKQFCDKYHTQNYGNSSIKLGVYYKNELVAVMTFSKLSIAKGNKNKKNAWELNRYCSSHNVIGGAGKLMEYFKRNFKWEYILTFADRRWSQGNLYKKLGFEFVMFTPINYWYWDKEKRNIKRFHRFRFRKDRIKHLGNGNQTEWEIMQSIGWSRIWDCGNYKFELINNGKYISKESIKQLEL